MPGSNKKEREKMLYYRIKKEFDQKRRKDGQIYIANELYTEHEKNLFNIPEKYIESVNISRKKTYFAFGARFSA